MTGDSNGNPDGHALDRIVYNAHSIQPRIQGLVSQALVPELCDVETRREGKEVVEWHITKGRARYDGHDVRLAQRMPHAGKPGDDDDYVLSTPTLIWGSNTNDVLGHLEGGILVNNDMGLSTFDVSDHVYRDAERILTDIVNDSRGQVAAERAAKVARRSGRIRFAVKSVIALGMSGVLAWQTPNAIEAVDQWRQHEAIQRTQDRERAATARQAADMVRQQTVADFDRAHPIIRTGELLMDNVARVVPFTQEFDGTEVPPLEGAAASVSIRSLELPKSGQCKTVVIEIPEGQVMRVARTGDPREIVTATQDSVGNEMEVCDRNFHKVSEADEKVVGRLFLQLAQR